jgi:hypothetical protein
MNAPEARDYGFVDEVVGTPIFAEATNGTE